MAEPIITLEGVSKSFGDTRAVDDVSFSVPAGGFLGLLGPNGAGKTTLIHMLCGLNRIGGGRITVKGLDVGTHSLEVRRSLGVVPQELVYDPYFNVRRCLELQSSYYGLTDNGGWITELLERLDLAEKADSRTRALSGGMKRRLMIAQALVHRPPIIVLDEPTAGVDINLRRSLWEFIREFNEAGHTILLTTHYLEEAEELCNDIILMDHGRVIASENKRALLERFKSITLMVRLSGGRLPPAYDRCVRAEQSDPGTGHYVLTLERYPVIEDFLRDMREAGVSVDMMEIGHPDLEDIFIDLIAHHERQGERAR